MTNEQTKKLLDEYKNDPVSFRLKYGATAEAELLETAHKKGMTKEVETKKMQMGGIADMSAAPMVRPRKKKTQSGFRSKYSKGGGVRAAKYKI
jgi:hypothetical protein|tara:strand:+ start:926 stop:1204 length:279 start_codon:yes stop_codon:yes gene_type:complete